MLNDNNTCNPENYFDIDKFLEEYKDKNSYVNKNEYFNIREKWVNEHVDKVYAIVMPNRKKYIEKLMTALKIDVEIVGAVNKNQTSKKDLITSKKISKNSKLTLGRICCHLSHLKVLNKFLENKKNKTCLIFEDDLKIPERPEYINEEMKIVIKDLPKDWDLLNIGKCWEECNKMKYITKNLVRSYPYCRHAYIVNRKGAEKIVSNTLPIKNLTGDQMYKSMSKKNELLIYSSVLPLFTQNRSKFGSELNNYDILGNCLYGNIDEDISVVLLNNNFDDEDIEKNLIKLSKIENIKEVIIGISKYYSIEEFNNNKDINYDKYNFTITFIPNYEYYESHGDISKILLARKSNYENILFLNNNNNIENENIKKLIEKYQKDKYNVYTNQSINCDDKGCFLVKKDREDYIILSKYVLNKLSKNIEKTKSKENFNNYISKNFKEIFGYYPKIVAL